MKKTLIVLTAFLICASLTAGLFGIRAYGQENTEDITETLEEIRQGILDYYVQSAGVPDILSYAETVLPGEVTANGDWKALAFLQSGEDIGLAAYREALETHVEEKGISNAATALRAALILRMTGSRSGFIRQTADEKTGKLGVMSLVFGLHLYGNGIGSAAYTEEELITEILKKQFDDGGFSVYGEESDVDVTAMVLTALAPYRESFEEAAQGVDRCLSFLVSRQEEDGGFLSMGIESPESSAQVMVALSALGIDCLQDERFVKNGRTLLDSILDFRMEDGSFCHIAGYPGNETSTVQVLYAIVAYERFLEGKTPLFLKSGLQEYESVESAGPEETEKETAGPSDSREETEKETAGPSDSREETEKETAAPAGDKDHGRNPNKGGLFGEITPVKRWILAGIAVFTAAGILILILKKKKSARSYLSVIAAAVFLSALTLLIKVSSADEFYHPEEEIPENGIRTYLEIRCDTVAGEKEFIPEDGVILPRTEIILEKGQNAYDQLLQAARKYQIQMENSGGAAAYINGMAYLYEFDFGELSGWVFSVNGSSAGTGCSEHIMQEGDEVLWQYSRNIGKDLKE